VSAAGVALYVVGARTIYRELRQVDQQFKLTMAASNSGRIA
jgi:hypothetical protein